MSVQKAQTPTCLSPECCPQNVVLEPPKTGSYKVSFCWTRSCTVYRVQKTVPQKGKEGEKKIVCGGPYRACGPSRKFLPTNPHYFKFSKLGLLLGSADVWKATSVVPLLSQIKNKRRK